MEESGNDLDYVNSKVMHMMAKMGYKSGAGLGKYEKGAVTPLPLIGNLGRKGLGHTLKRIKCSNEEWDFTIENCKVKEDFDWIENTKTDYDLEEMDFSDWIVRGPFKENIDSETEFCDENILAGVLRAKDIFDQMPLDELNKARTRANPFETIRSAFFMNRAALKMANIDAATDHMFSKVDENPLHHKTEGAYYFADVCGGPGGFSEYILWRKQWMFKGIGFTLKGNWNFKLENSGVIFPLNFNSEFGKRGDGDVFFPENIKSFSEAVHNETDGFGVHFMVADGGFCVDGQENLQEVLSKQLYVCQCLTALLIVRPNGHFVTKMFDVYTSFSVGLIFLMYHCFDKITILKPNTSRPANSERYLICYGLRSNSLVAKIKQHLWSIVNKLNAIRQIQNNFTIDINEIIPTSIIKSDEDFMKFIVTSNNRLGRDQIVGLQKLGVFCRNSILYDPRQEAFRVECLDHWQIPQKVASPWLEVTKAHLNDMPDFFYTPAEVIHSIVELTEALKSIQGWSYLPLTYQGNVTTNLYAGVAKATTFRLQGEKWAKMKAIPLLTGTCIYGELVKNDESDTQNQTLQIIDAMQIGNRFIGDLCYSERFKLIQTYCEAINFKSKPQITNMRVKLITALENLDWTNSAIKNETKYFCASPTSSLPKTDESYNLNSILLLRTNLDDTFMSTFTSRLILVLKNDKGSNSNDLTLKSFIKFVQDKL